jgi:hypothetical protein
MLLTNRLNNGVRVLAMATATATATLTDRRMFHIHDKLARFSNYLVSFLVSVYLLLLVSQKETNIWPSIHDTNKKRCPITITLLLNKLMDNH